MRRAPVVGSRNVAHIFSQKVVGEKEKLSSVVAVVALTRASKHASESDFY